MLCISPSENVNLAIPIRFVCPSPSCCLDGLDGLDAHPSGYWQKVFFISDFFARAALSVLRQCTGSHFIKDHSFLRHSPPCILFSESCHRCQNIDNGSYLGEMDECDFFCLARGENRILLPLY